MVSGEGSDLEGKGRSLPPYKVGDDECVFGPSGLRSQKQGCGRNAWILVRVGGDALSKVPSLLLLVALGSQAVAPATAEGPAGATPEASPCLAVTQAPRSSGPAQGSTTALQTALSLISMTSPRNLQPQRATLAPSFVEFDMSVEGYGYDRLSYI